jgi:biopolymer transport protein ExbB
MLSKIFLGLSLLGAEWVLYFLVLLSVTSVAIILERLSFYKKASRGLVDFRTQIRHSISQGQLKEAIGLVETRRTKQTPSVPDLETDLTYHLVTSDKQLSSSILNEKAQDSVIRAKISWDKNLSLLATIGSNAPFIGLFGTVLGIIKAFHDLSEQTPGGPSQIITGGISEALVATAVGLLVAIPAVVAFNLFQRHVKMAVSEAEALKSFLVGHLATSGSTTPPTGRDF